MKKLFGILLGFLIILIQVGCTGTSEKGVPVSGIYEVQVSLEGGSGRASVEPDSILTVTDEGMTVKVTWSSANYDYMVVDGNKYLPINTSGNSVFEIPVPALDEGFTVVGDTVAMSTPHEIEYILTVSLAGDENALSKDLDKTLDDDEVSLKSSDTNKDNNNLAKWISDNLGEKEEYELEYAKCFKIDKYKDEVYIITIDNSSTYLVTSQVEEYKDKLIDGLDVIPISPQDIYVVGSGSMDFFVALDALDRVSYSSLEKNSWHLDEVSAAMNAGDILYAGKYSAPDFELLVSRGCDLVVENTMISHKPEILLQLQNLGFSTIVDFSSYEDTALGRMEWIKLYGLLTGRLSEAEQIFEVQRDKILKAKLLTDGQPVSASFFSITTAGTVSVRKSNDYITDVIAMAGGEYGLKNAVDEGSGSMVIQMESFYEAAKDCDIMIYNSTIEGEISSKEDLAAKCPLIEKCKAYNDDRIYCTTASFYQAVMELGDITLDIRRAIDGEEPIKYLVKVQ